MINGSELVHPSIVLKTKEGIRSGFPLFILKLSTKLEAIEIFGRGDKRLDHFCLNEVAVELSQLAEPEIVTVEVCIWTRVWVAAQVTEVLHQHKCLINFALTKVCVLGD